MSLNRREVLAAGAATALGGLPRARAQGSQVIRLGVLTDMSGPYRDTTGRAASS